MLIKIFELSERLKGENLAASIRNAVANLSHAWELEQIQVRFSNLPSSAGMNSLRVLVTGLDALGYERKITREVGEVCRQYYQHYGLDFPGLSNPELPNQK